MLSISPNIQLCPDLLYEFLQKKTQFPKKAKEKVAAIKNGYYILIF
jgi:hypothetical protein